jgi:hypothetical protein
VLFYNEDGSLWGCGCNVEGQLGMDHRICGVNVTVFTKVDTDVCFTEVSAGYDYTLALDTFGGVWAFGSTTSQQLGELFGDDKFRHIPTRIPNIPSMKQVCANDTVSYFLDLDGRVWYLGCNGFDELDETASFPKVNPYLKNIVQIDGLYSGVWCLGHNELNRMSFGETDVPKIIPVPTVHPFLHDVIHVSASEKISFAINSENKILLWGERVKRIMSGNDMVGTTVADRIKEIYQKKFSHMLEKRPNTLSGKDTIFFRKLEQVIDKIQLDERSKGYCPVQSDKDLVNFATSLMTEEECINFYFLLTQSASGQRYCKPRVVDEFGNCSIIFSDNYFLVADCNGLVRYFKEDALMSVLNIRWNPRIQSTKRSNLKNAHLKT